VPVFSVQVVFLPSPLGTYRGSDFSDISHAGVVVLRIILSMVVGLWLLVSGRGGAVSGAEGLQDRSRWRPLCTLIIGCGTSVVTVLMKAVASTFSLGFIDFRTVGPWDLGV
jgi:hypothetical protein